ncbi:hypothetical protein QE152_g38508 [Popillia japonica]|uniref:C3H1-type domain-containing protein n=1 Tax=Popillia japonica TaxID=7064 RepID=A0AAW1HWI9_POPJA
MDFEQRQFSSCVFASQGSEVFDIEDFGNFTSTVNYAHPKGDDFQMPLEHHQSMDYSNLQYYESEQFSPNSITSDTNMYNYCDVPTLYNDDQNCSIDYEVFGHYNGNENGSPVLCPVKPHSVLAQLPCKTNENWDYNQCFSYFANGCYNTCQFVHGMDIEDFM